MGLGASQKRIMIVGPLLMAAASCVPSSGLNMAGSPVALAASARTAAPAKVPEWAKLEPGMPYRLLSPAVAPALPFSGEARSEDDKLRSLECLTQAIYYEAASESEDGQRAVAQVVLNRVRHSAYPNTVCGVIYQGSERRTGCQFTFTCDGSLARRPAAFPWARARRIAAEALAGEVYGPVGNATHYHTTSILPYWAHSLTRAAVVGAHVFYRWKGPQGSTEAFNQQYAGVEPGAAPLRHQYEPVPVTLASAEIVESGVRKWRGATPEVRIHRGSSIPASAPAAEAPAEQESFGVQVHRGAETVPTS
jgi:spore germination cell wall hydrolase CwlJ-like protein